MKIDKFYLNFLILGILIRLLIMPFFFHPDIKTYHFQASFLQKGVWDIYSYLPEHKNSLPLKEEFVYFPLTYFSLGFYQWAISPLLGPDFYSWLSDASASAVDRIGIFGYLFLLKFPYLILDCLVAFLLVRLFSDESEKRKVFLFWLFNPFSIIFLYIFSNIDIFPVFLTVLSLLFVKKRNYAMAGFLLGLGAGFKAYPILFIPFLILRAEKWKDKITVLVASLIPLIIIIAPFLKSPGFQQATINSGLTNRIISNGIPIGFGEILYPGVLILAGIYFLAAYKKVIDQFLARFYFISLLAIFMTIHFHIQWLLWILPFGVVILASKKNWTWRFLFLITLAILIPLFYDDSSMTVSTLSVINPLFQNLPTPYKLIEHFYDPSILQSILHSIFLGVGLVTIFQLFKEEKA